MTRFVCCLALALSVAACVPPKATVVEEAPATPARRKPANAPAAPEAEPPRVTQESGMRVPTGLIERLPDRRDMTPTADPKPGGAIAIPPTADKRDDP